MLSEPIISYDNIHFPNVGDGEVKDLDVIGNGETHLNNGSYGSSAVMRTVGIVYRNGASKGFRINTLGSYKTLINILTTRGSTVEQSLKMKRSLIVQGTDLEGKNNGILIDFSN